MTTQNAKPVAGNWKLPFIIFLSSCLAAHAAPLFTDADFATFPTGWNQINGTDAATAVEAVAPSGGADTNSLNFLDNSNAAAASVNTIINGGSEYTSAMTISFDIKMTLVMIDSTHAQANQLFLRVYDAAGYPGGSSSAHAATSLIFSRSEGVGSSASMLAFQNGSGIVSGFFQPDAWYHINLSLSEVGGAGATITMTSLGSGILQDKDSVTVSSVTMTQALGGSVTDYKSLWLSSGNTGVYYTDANVSNIVAVPEPASWILAAVGLSGALLLRHRKSNG